MPMPAECQPAPGQELAANRGLESLALLQRQAKPGILLMAAEPVLLQDPAGQVRLLGGDPSAPARPLRPAKQTTAAAATAPG